MNQNNIYKRKYCLDTNVNIEGNQRYMIWCKSKIIGF